MFRSDTQCFLLNGSDETAPKSPNTNSNNSNNHGGCCSRLSPRAQEGLWACGEPVCLTGVQYDSVVSQYAHARQKQPTQQHRNRLDSQSGVGAMHTLGWGIHKLTVLVASSALTSGSRDSGGMAVENTHTKHAQKF